MKDHLIPLVLAAALVWPQGGSAGDDQATLDLGIRQVKGVDLSKAVVTLDGVIQRLNPQASTNARELSQACLWKGVALVGLQQEEPAKSAFRDALRHDPALRLNKGEQPDRVVRVFEAARTGKTKSAMQRPTGTAKTAGPVGGGITLIVLGAVAAAGGVAVAASGGGGEEGIKTGEGGVISFLGSTPPPGSTVTVQGSQVPLTMQVTIRGPVSAGTIDAKLRHGNQACTYTGQLNQAAVPSGQTVTVTFPATRILDDSGGCALPVTTDRVVVDFFVGNDAANPGAIGSFENVAYTLVRCQPLHAVGGHADRCCPTLIPR